MAVASKQLGGSLLLALIFSAAMSTMLLLLMEATILDQKMLQHYLAKKKNHLNYFFELKAIEQQLAQSFDIIHPSVDVLEWVPDTLTCQEKSGIRYYQIRRQLTQADGASNDFQSIYAVRGSLPAGRLHPNTRYCQMAYMGTTQGEILKIVNGQNAVIPLAKWLPISNLIEPVIIGQGEGQSVRIYALAQKKFHPQQVIVILIDEQNKAPYIEQIIDPETTLNHMILRNKRLIVNNDKVVMVFDAFSGILLAKETLLPMGVSDIKVNSEPLSMQVSKPYETKRVIQARTRQGWVQAEIAMDDAVLGRKTWHET